MACDKCVEKSIKCVHKKHHIPAWKSGERQLIAEALVEGQETTRRQEMLGMISSDNVYCFVHSWINAFVRRQRWFFSHPVQVIHVGIDPSGGGEGSEFAIMSISFDGPYAVVSLVTHTYHNIKYHCRIKSTKNGTLLNCKSSGSSFTYRPPSPGFNPVRK